VAGGAPRRGQIYSTSAGRIRGLIATNRADGYPFEATQIQRLNGQTWMLRSASLGTDAPGGGAHMGI
jgi:hypothetical protein